jgi:hypothetical protein
MDPSQLTELESLCVAMYNSHNPAERTHAENALRPFSTNTDYIPQCKVRADTTPHSQHAPRALGYPHALACPRGYVVSYKFARSDTYTCGGAQVAPRLFTLLALCAVPAVASPARSDVSARDAARAASSRSQWLKALEIY